MDNFPTITPLEFDTINILGELATIPKNTNYFLVTLD